jgi:hypothetical protein
MNLAHFWFYYYQLNDLSPYLLILNTAFMFLKYLLVFLLSLIGISCIVLLVIFLASAAIFGSFFLPLICIVSLALFFYGASVLHKKQEV